MASPAPLVRVENFRELNRAFAKASDRSFTKEFRGALREASEPIRRDAEILSATRIRNITRRWARARVGITRSEVYVAPVARGVKTRGPDPRRRPNLKTLILEKSYDPALARNEKQVVSAVERMLDGNAREWGRGG